MRYSAREELAGEGWVGLEGMWGALHREDYVKLHFLQKGLSPQQSPCPCQLGLGFRRGCELSSEQRTLWTGLCPCLCLTLGLGPKRFLWG